MANRTPLTAENPITLEMLNSFVQGVQVVPQTNINEIELWTKSAIESELAKKADKSNFTKFIFNESVTTLKDGYTYYGCTINHTVSSGTYYFYNCTGALTVSGKFATIYATNCPSLTINASYWMNIWVDGVASNSDKTAIRFADGTQICQQTYQGNYESSSYYQDVFFPVSFSTTTGLNVIVTPYMTDTGSWDQYAYMCSPGNINTSWFTLYVKELLDPNMNVNRCNYIAIGRWKS